MYTNKIFSLLLYFLFPSFFSFFSHPCENISLSLSESLDLISKTIKFVVIQTKRKESFQMPSYLLRKECVFYAKSMYSILLFYSSFLQSKIQYSSILFYIFPHRTIESVYELYYRVLNNYLLVE